VTLLETRMITFGRFGVAGTDRLAKWLNVMTPEIVPFDEAQATVAFAAFTIYGKGIHSQARLNMGDCVACAR